MWSVQVIRLLASALLFALVPILASAGSCEHVLRQLEGWTVVSVTSIEGEFEGCDYGKRSYWRMVRCSAAPSTTIPIPTVQR